MHTVFEKSPQQRLGLYNPSEPVFLAREKDDAASPSEREQLRQRELWCSSGTDSHRNCQRGLTGESSSYSPFTTNKPEEKKEKKREYSG
ncbi:hypothetical protein CRENBAI_004124 [Crenichthys baileyi]|uniref:Uncharacterized protein n=1 Tax=Crenichthys baileyi TaxID=28760 RepID=A0AAV9R3I2_9TELE